MINFLLCQKHVPKTYLKKHNAGVDLLVEVLTSMHLRRILSDPMKKGANDLHGPSYPHEFP